MKQKQKAESAHIFQFVFVVYTKQETFFPKNKSKVEKLERSKKNVFGPFEKKQTNNAIHRARAFLGLL